MDAHSAKKKLSNFWEKVKIKWSWLKLRFKSPAQVLREVEKKTPIQLLEEYLKDESNRKKIFQTAKSFHQLSAGQWFDLRWVVNKTKYDTGPEALKILNLIKLSGQLIAEIKNGKEMYKVVLTKDAKRIALESILEKTKQKQKDIELELLELEKV